jgi:hypothetical protein
MTVNPKPVTIAKTVSTTAAQRPETKQFSGPNDSVRRMQIRLTGPIGTATTSPITTPDTIRIK